MDEEGIRGRPREESGIDLPASKPYCYRPGNIYQDPCRWSVFLGRGKEEAVHRSEVIRSAFYQFRGKSNKKESKSNEHVPISHALIPILVPPNADPSTVHYENWEIELERSDKTLWEIVRARERFACFSSFFFYDRYFPPRNYVNLKRGGISFHGIRPNLRTSAQRLFVGGKVVKTKTDRGGRRKAAINVLFHLDERERKSMSGDVTLAHRPLHSPPRRFVFAFLSPREKNLCKYVAKRFASGSSTVLK